MILINDDASTGIVALKCAGPKFFILDNCLHCMNERQKPAIYLRFTALIYYLICIVLLDFG